MAKKSGNEPDAVFFLKILLYFILGFFWVKVNGIKMIPAGLIFGLVFAHHDHFRIDRKLEYVILLTSAFIGFLAAG